MPSRMETLLSLTAQLSSERDLDHLLEQIMDAVTLLLDAERSSLFRLDREQGVLCSQIAQGINIGKIELLPGEGVAGHVARSGELVNISNLAEESGFDSRGRQYNGFVVHSMLCAPMKNPHGEVLGVIQAMNKKCGRFTKNDEMLFTALASQACVAIENAELYMKLQQHADLLQQQVLERTRKIQEKNTELKALNRELEALAVTDGLTGVYNRRYFNQAIVRECQLAQRHGRPTSLIMLDIDQFKQINDRYGHQAGDYVIMALSEVLRHTVRNSDILARPGGDEFTVLSTVATLEQARLLAGRLRKNVEKHAFTYASEPVPVTISLGVAEWNDGMDTDGLALIKHADNALYRAKSEGRNRVCVAGDQLRLIRNSPEG
ncbi:MAG: sensor domain-containing diguanylate cyclase [Mariprofundaceae bacterium]|nr:sensor domain-containing diguanylate cyclase [Mariprofundaceae bacterium]